MNRESCSAGNVDSRRKARRDVWLVAAELLPTLSFGAATCLCLKINFTYLPSTATTPLPTLSSILTFGLQKIAEMSKVRGVFPLFLVTALGIVNGNSSRTASIHEVPSSYVDLRSMGIRPSPQGPGTRKGGGKAVCSSPYMQLNGD